MTIECADVRELAPEMALGSLDGAVRADVLGHMAHCPTCRAEVRDLADVVDGLAGLAPAVEPPAGLPERVLAAIRAETPAPLPAASPRRRWRTRQLVIGAVAAAVLGVVGTVSVVAARHTPSPDVALNARTLRVVPMVGIDDHRLGDAYVSRGQDPWVLVNVAYGLDGASYRLVGVDGEGTVFDIGAMRSLTDGRWAWAGRVDRIPSLVELRIVDGAGGVACRAQIV